MQQARCTNSFMRFFTFETFVVVFNQPDINCTVYICVFNQLSYVIKLETHHANETRCMRVFVQILSCQVRSLTTSHE